MEIKADQDCKKGDIAKETLKFQILVERSSTKDDVTISLWKSQSDRFEVARYDEKKDKWESILNNKNEAEARREYEEYCYKNDYLPYLEAKDYFRRKGLLTEPTE